MSDKADTGSSRVVSHPVSPAPGAGSDGSLQPWAGPFEGLCTCGTVWELSFPCSVHRKESA
jgi:hypothetical protein